MQTAGKKQRHSETEKTELLQFTSVQLHRLGICSLQIFIALISLLIAPVIALAQVNNFEGQVPHAKTFNLKDLYDSTYGIELFDKFNANLGGDSIRKNDQGYAANGWIEDHYTDGSLLHKGFYADGQVNLYTNYYPNGQEERVYKSVSERKAEMKKYYMDGKPRSEVEYFDGNAISYHDYYDNGQPSYVEEYDKKHETLIQRCSYYRDGKPQSIFVPESDKKNARYSHKEYYPNGQLKEEYEMISSSGDYVKDGEDKQYDDKGNLTSDILYDQGEESKVIK